jgi:uncharacterized protein
LISALRDLLLDSGTSGLALAGLAIGFSFGALAQWGNFCTMGCIADTVTMGDTRRLRAWALAAAIAIIGVGLMRATGTVDLSKSMYLVPRLNWAGHLVGGAVFGFGMVLAGGCASRNLVRTGTGDVRALLSLFVTSLFAAMTLGGILGPLRSRFEDQTQVTLSAASSSVIDLGAPLWGASSAVQLWLPLILGIAIIGGCFSLPRFWTAKRYILSGLGTGVLVTLAWLLTGLAYDEMAERVQNPVALSFVKPTADTLDWLERATAIGLPGFSVATVFGTVLGAALVAWFQGRFKIVTFAGRGDTARHLSGAALMGIGGVMALGCSIGQGVSGLSTLSLGSMIAVGAMLGGAVVAIKALERYAA